MVAPGDVERFVVGGSERERVDKALARLVSGASRAEIQRWIAAGLVEVAGRPCGARELVEVGTEILLRRAPAPSTKAARDPSVPFAVIYEDAALLVIDKPAGVVVHPARGHATGTLVNGLVARGSFDRELHDEDSEGDASRPGIVHRIDKDTSGLIVVARTAQAREHLKAQLAEHSMERRYLGLTLGVPRGGRIESTHARHPRSRLRFTSRATEGKRAVTRLELVEALAGGRAALVACRLETGRTHQIRVHLSEQRGTPLLADALYGVAPKDPAVAAIASALGRQALHAETLGFTHPESGLRLSFRAEPPPDFAAALAALRALS